MAYHKTLLYLGVIFVIADMYISFPSYSVSYFGILLILIGYFKWKIYKFIMRILWLAIFIEVIYDISRFAYKFLFYMKNKQDESPKKSEDILKTPTKPEEKEKEEKEEKKMNKTIIL